ncbi:hypothetical protein SALBM135S_00301 [Streptomyces alboniger]
MAELHATTSAPSACTAWGPAKGAVSDRERRRRQVHARPAPGGARPRRGRLYAVYSARTRGRTSVREAATPPPGRPGATRCGTDGGTRPALAPRRASACCSASSWRRSTARSSAPRSPRSSVTSAVSAHFSWGGHGLSAHHRRLSTPIWGKVGDLYGRKGSYLTAIVVFLVGSVLSRTCPEHGAVRSPSAPSRGSARAASSWGRSPASGRRPPAQAGRAQSMIGVMLPVAMVGGPLLGGFLTDQLDWRWVFYVNVPVGIAALLLVGILITLARRARRGPHRLRGHRPPHGGHPGPDAARNLGRYDVRRPAALPADRGARADRRPLHRRLRCAWSGAPPNRSPRPRLFFRDRNFTLAQALDPPRGRGDCWARRKLICRSTCSSYGACRRRRAACCCSR